MSNKKANRETQTPNEIMRRLESLYADISGHRKAIQESNEAIGCRQFERTTLALALLADPAFLNNQFGGDYEKAVRAIQRDYFMDLSGAMTLDKLFEIHAEIPAESEWRKHGSDLLLMLGMAREKKLARKRASKTGSECEAPIRRRATVAMLEETRKEARDAVEEAAVAKTEAELLREENARLKEENIRLSATVATLERQLHSMMGVPHRVAS